LQAEPENILDRAVRIRTHTARIRSRGVSAEIRNAIMECDRRICLIVNSDLCGKKDMGNRRKENAVKRETQMERRRRRRKDRKQSMKFRCL
jgi:hypothetical protein